MSVKDREGSLWYLELPAARLRPVEVTSCPSTIIKKMVCWLTPELNNAHQLKIKHSITSKYARGSKTFFPGGQSNDPLVSEWPVLKH